MTVKTWLANELEFTSTKTYQNPFEDVDIDMVFTLGKRKMTFPGFWDGGNTWRVRFSLPKEGVWNYELVCTDKENIGLQTKGTLECVKYDGDLEIYKRGFIKTEPDKRYFMYNDGTPFFYLGDTHWNFLKEEFDEPGDHAGDLECDSHFKYIVDKRWEQGFNVYQSEPIGANYSLSEGLFEKDLIGFRELDVRFKYIADKGFVHANAQLLFPRLIIWLKRYDDKEYIKRLGRYWAARYSAYPCLWTLGQEVDNDFYYTRGDQKKFTKENNPFILVAEGLHKNDAHKQPLTGHMEFFSYASGPANDGTSPSTSAFRNVEGHNWYGYQWSRGVDKPIDYTFGRDGLLNGQGKVCILYESRYEGLWTKNLGARSEGWLAYLNGLYGYGYGCADIWLYKGTYQMNHDSFDGVDTITPEDKAIFWSKAVEYETAYQLKYMKDFFEKLQWWKLIPRFDAASYFVSDKENFHSIATDERDTMVIYFCNIGYETGKLTNLDDAEYTYQWFNPRTGKYHEKRSFWPDSFRSYHIEQKPDKMDWAILIEKKK